VTGACWKGTVKNDRMVLQLPCGVFFGKEPIDSSAQTDGFFKPFGLQPLSRRWHTAEQDGSSRCTGVLLCSGVTFACRLGC